MNVPKTVAQTNENHCFFKLRKLISRSDLHRKGSWHQILRLWRSLGHRKATRRASRRSPRAPKSDQESFKEIFKSSKVTIHGVCQVIMSLQGAVGSPQRAPKELLESQNEVQSSPKEVHRTFREVRIEEKPHRKSSGHQSWRLWRSLGHREATTRASRRSSRAPKSRSIKFVE